MNQVYLLGRLGSDAETQRTQSGTSIAKFSLATTERRGETTETHWHQIVAYGKTAEISAPMLKKGVEAFVQGKIWARNWKDKNGKDHLSFEIVANVIRVATPRSREIQHEDLQKNSLQSQMNDGLML